MPGIRDQLEQNLWHRYPRFARRHARRTHGGGARPVRRLAWQDRALLILASLLVLLLIVRVETARAQAPATAPHTAWGIEAQAGDASVRSLALNTDIAVEISGLAARVVVSQRFRNDGAHWQEAVYRFPLPAGAAVDRLRVEAAGRVLEGEIREKEEARRQYRQAREAGKLASLVEQQRPDQFETRLANIAPGAEIRVEIGFLAQVDFADGTFGLNLPMTFTPRFEPPVGARSAHEDEGPGHTSAPHPILAPPSGDHRLSLDIVLHSALGLASIESRFHDVDIQPEPGGYRIRLADPETRADRVFELNWTPDYGQAPVSSLLSWDGGDAVYALLMLAPPLPGAVARQPREVVFVIDTSGSMEGDSLRQARAALRQGLEFLGPDDRFNLVRFASDADLLFEESAPARRAYLDQAADYIDRLRADGGTNMKPALDLALGLPARNGLLRQVVFITDGSVGNEGELLLQVAERLGDSRLFPVSIGAAPNRWFMRKAAVIGRGSHTHIGRQEEVASRMSALWSRIENPALRDVCVDWGMEAETYPELIPDLYAGEPLWLYARLPHQPREVTVCGELDGRHWETAAVLNPADGGPDVTALWAHGKIESLEDSRIFGVDPQLIREEVLDLALRFGLLTRYTGLVAVDRTPARPAGEALQTGDVPSLLPAGSATTAGFTQTATGWPLRLALSLLALFLATGMLLFSAPSRPARHARGPAADAGRAGGTRRLALAAPRQRHWP